MKRTFFLLGLIAASLLLLVYGPDGLVLYRLPGGLPLGTLFAIVSLVAGSAIPLAASRRRTALRWAGVAALLVALAWFPIGVWLSGNVDLNFVSDAADSVLFRQVTIGSAAFIIATWAWSAVVGWRSYRKRRIAIGEQPVATGG
ncbi:MAG: hypothetical protein AAGK21_14795 [Bacteroidota bacterium]